MSPHVGNFVQDLVEMAKATERLPGLEAELSKAHSDIESYAKQVQDREMHIIELKAEIDAKNEFIRSLEVAKDQAETMFLELDEKAGKVLAIRSDIADKINAMFDLLEPPKPQPEPVKAEPTEAMVETGPTTEREYADYVQGQHEPTGNVDQGQGEANPTSTGTTNPQTQTTDAHADISPQTANPTEQTVSTEPSPGRYSGRRYYDHPAYVPREEWVAQGGTDENYDWRPSRFLA